MSTLDASVVNVALPTLVRDLETDIGTVEWVVTSYLLVLTATLLVFGKLSDRLGRRQVYVGGLIVFTVASALCATASSIESLVVFRGVQGLGASMLTAVGPALIVDAFPESQRGRALGMLAIAVGGGLITGPAIGGVLLGLLSWRWIFLLNLPVGGLAIAVSFWALSTGTRPRVGRFDWLGALLGTVTLASILAFTSLGPEYGWVSPGTLAVGAAFIVCAILFVVVEQRVDEPTFDLGMLRIPRVRDGLIACLLSFIAVFLPVYLIPFYLQDIVGMTPLRMGLTMTSLPIALLVSGPIAGWVTDHYGAIRVGPLGMTLLGVALLAVGWMGGHTPVVVIAASLATIGCGMGMFSSPNNAEVLSAIDAPRRGSLSAALAVNRNLGTVLGITCASTVFQVVYRHAAHAPYTFVAGMVPDASAFDSAFRVPMFIGVAAALATAALAYMTMRPVARQKALARQARREAETVAPTTPP